MQTARELLDAVKTRHGINSDYALAKFLGVTRSSISVHRCHDHTFHYDLAAKVAAALEKPEEEVILLSLAERAKCAPEKAAYLRLLELVKTRASSDPPPKNQ